MHTDNEHTQSLLLHLRSILESLDESEYLAQESHSYFMERFDELLESPQDRYLGQELISQIFHRYPQIAHLVPRDLLWFFGGDCLHFMPDEEIALYQAKEEQQAL